MSDASEDARRYRARAGEIRARAETFGPGKNQEMLLRIANDYDHMADTLDRIDATYLSIADFSNSN